MTTERIDAQTSILIGRKAKDFHDAFMAERDSQDKAMDMQPTFRQWLMARRSVETKLQQQQPQLKQGNSGEDEEEEEYEENVGEGPSQEEEN